MPPPTMTTDLGCAPQVVPLVNQRGFVRLHDRRHNVDQCSRGVQHGNTFQLQALRLGQLLQFDIDIVQGFHMVANEPDRCHQHMVMAFLGQLSQRFFDRRAEPLFPDRPWL